MRVLAAASIVFVLALGLSAQAQETAPALPYDSPIFMREMEAVCTGVGEDARNDPRWPTYPLRIELVGRAGEYLGEALVSLAKGSEPVISVRCSGPWLLLKLPPGAYNVTAEVEGRKATSRANVAAAGQARVVLRFPDLGQPTGP